MSKHTPESTHDYATKRVNEAYRETTGATDDIIKPSVKHTPSAGAMRAAERALNYSESWINPNKKFYAKRDSLAAIIDEETHVGELLDALKRVVDRPNSIAANEDAIIAIAKAEVGHD